MEDILLTIPEAAKRLGVSQARLYIWIQQGRIPTVLQETRYGKPGTKPRQVYRIPESKCIIPLIHKTGPKPPELPRITVKPKTKRPKKPTPINRKRPVDLK